MAWSAAVGAPFGWSMVLFGTGLCRSVTDEDGWAGLSSGVSDVRRTPRLFSWLALLREVGIPSEGERENPSKSSGVRSQTPGLVARLFVGFLVLEESKIVGSDSTGGRMMAPRAVA